VGFRNVEKVTTAKRHNLSVVTVNMMGRVEKVRE
jgi:hypothetical protein